MSVYTDSAGGRPAAQENDPSASNPGEPLDLEWVLAPHVDETAIDSEVSRLRAQSATPGEGEVARLLRAIRSIDLTTLAGDDTPDRVRALCARARQPLAPELLERLPAGTPGARVAAVCVYHHFIETARRALEGSGIPVAVASAGFPAGLSPLRQRVDEIRSSIEAGAQEIDAVINRSLALTGEWEALYAEVREFRAASGRAPLKVILATGELRTLDNVARVSRLCLQAGADFLKTSTGKEAVNASYPAGLVMLRELVEYRRRSGRRIGFKPAGGIRTPDQAMEWMRLVQETAGEEALCPDRFRIGASGVLSAIAERLAQLAGADPLTPPGEASAY
jgi:deoxyribose-phosphate aldolase